MKSDFDVLMGINVDGDVPVCMGGVWHLETDEPGVGVVWMLCTDDVSNHPITLLRELKKEFKKYDEEYWLLYNFMLSEDTQWLYVRARSGSSNGERRTRIKSTCTSCL